MGYITAIACCLICRENMRYFKLNLKSDCLDGFLNDLRLCSFFWKNLGINFSGKLVFKFRLVSCFRVRMGLSRICRLNLYGAWSNYGQKLV
jgi:hypothetical protein